MRMWVAVIILSLFYVAGCSSIGANDRSFVMSQAEEESYKDVSVNDAVIEEERRWNAAVKEDLTYYAPKNLKRARKYIDEARDILVQLGKPSPKVTKKDIISKLALAKSYTTKGLEVKAFVLDKLNDPLSRKEYLRSIDKEKAYTKDIARCEADIVDLIDDIEMEKMEKLIQHRDDLVKRMQSLEERITIDKALNEARLRLKMFVDKEFEDIAPLTYKEALDELSRSELQIRKATRDENNVKDAAKKALFATKRALTIGLEVAKLRSTKPDEIEAYVRSLSDLLSLIGTSMESEDVRDRLISEQAIALAKRAGELSNTVKFLDRKPQEPVVSSPIPEPPAPIFTKDQSSPQQGTANVKPDETVGEPAAKAEFIPIVSAEPVTEAVEEIISVPAVDQEAIKKTKDDREAGADAEAGTPE